MLLRGKLEDILKIKATHAGRQASLVMQELWPASPQASMRQYRHQALQQNQRAIYHRCGPIERDLRAPVS